MKKLCALFPLLLALLLLAPSALSQNEGDFVYTLSGGEATITAYTGSAAELLIPDSLGGSPVTAIRYCALRSCTSLTRVVIPEGVVSIGSRAFAGCRSLEEIVLPKSLSALGSHTFYGCAALRQLVLHDGIERLHPYAFYGCSAVRLCALDSRAAAVLTDYGYAFTSPEHPQLSLMAFDEGGVRTLTVADCDESAVCVSLPENVSAIGDYAFFGCDALEEIVLPEGVLSVGYCAFEGCASLERIMFPESVRKIADNAFSGCSGLTLVAPPESAAQAFAKAHGFAWQAP